MTPEQIQELIDTLMNMGETMATEVFRASLEYTVLMGWVGIGLTVLLLVVGVFVSVYVWREDGSGSGLFMLFIFFVVFAMAVAVSLPQLLTPEWIAIKNILDLLK